MQVGPSILGKSDHDVKCVVGIALLQIRYKRNITLTDMGKRLGVSDDSVAAYIAGHTEMGLIAFLRALAHWPELAETLDCFK